MQVVEIVQHLLSIDADAYLVVIGIGDLLLLDGPWCHLSDLKNLPTFTIPGSPGSCCLEFYKLVLRYLPFNIG